MSTEGNTNQGQSFSIQPHPAHTNDPNDLQKLQRSSSSVFNTPGIVIPSAADTLPEPLSREELQAAQARLNLQSSGESSNVLDTPGIVIPKNDNLPKPLSDEELQAAQARLNLQSSGESSNVLDTPGIVIPKNDNLPKPLSDEELQVAQAELNQA